MEKNKKGTTVIVMKGYIETDPELHETDMNNIMEELMEYEEACDSIEVFNSAEEAFCHELASNYYDPETENDQYKGLAKAFMNEDHLIDESVIIETVQAFKQL